jgi:hypothetical protein
MKKAVLLLITVVCLSFTTNRTAREFDKTMVGVWKGFEKDKQYEGTEKHWIQERTADGKYRIIFTAVQNCDVQTFVEKGKWWTEKGKFYEQAEDGKDIDVYQYEVVHNLVVKFKSITLLGKSDNTYEFEDYRID